MVVIENTFKKKTHCHTTDHLVITDENTNNKTEMTVFITSDCNSASEYVVHVPKKYNKINCVTNNKEVKKYLKVII